MPNPTVARQLVTMLRDAGVSHIYGVVGDSLNPVVDAVKRTEGIEWVHVSNEEGGAFAAAAEAQVTGQLAVCAGSCGPGNTHLLQGLYDAHRSGAPVVAIASHIQSQEIGMGFFQETHPERTFQDCSYWCEVVTPKQMPHTLRVAIQTAIGRRGVSVVVLPVELAGRVLAPVGHALGGKEWIQYDNPYDVGMNGLLGYGAAHKATHEADLLLLLGTDFPYTNFLPQRRTAQVAAQVDEVAADDAVFTVDTGMCNVWAARYLTPNGRRRVIGSFRHGSMANALPHAVGAQFAAPGRQVVSMSGDGGLAMLLGEVITVRLHRLPVKIVLFNNASLGMVKLEMMVDGIPDFETDHEPTDFTAIARGVGIPAMRVEDPREVRETLA